MPMQIKEHTRLLLPTLTVSVLLLLLGGLVAWYLHRSQQEASQLLSVSITRVLAAEELLLIGEELQKSVDQYLMTGERKFLTSKPRLIKEANQWIRAAEELTESDKDRALIDTLKNGYRQFLLELEQFADQTLSPQEAQSAVSGLNRSFRQQVFVPAREYQRFNHDRLKELTARAQFETTRMGALLLLIVGCGALGGLLAGFAVARRVQRRLLVNERAMAHSEQLATLGRLAAALAHELRNPLTSLRLITQSARTEGNQDSLEGVSLDGVAVDGNTLDEVILDGADFGILEQEIERMDSSIQTFLDYARPPDPEKRDCIAQSIIRQTVALVQRRAVQIGVEFGDELPMEPIEFQADPDQMRQVLLNILLNALDASPNGGLITLRARVAELPKDHRQEADRFESDSLSGGCLGRGPVVEIEVIDSGVGLPREQDDQIFDAFFSTKETGTGLGLAICKRIIEAHGGELIAKNANGAGAVFVVRLPKSQPPSTEETANAGTALGN